MLMLKNTPHRPNHLSSLTWTGLVARSASFVLTTSFLLGSAGLSPAAQAAAAAKKGGTVAKGSGASGSAAGKAAGAAALSYPQSKTVEQVDDYHGTKVKDPYRWLESLDTPETREWVEAQNKLTFGWLDKIEIREAMRTRLTELWNFEKYSPPYQEGGRYFYSKNDGLQNQSVVYTTTSLAGQPTVLLDPNSMSKDGTVALGGMSISHDGKLMAYGMAAAGSDWQEWRVRDVATGQDLPDVLKWIKFSGAAWTKDNKGFYYGRFDEPKGKEFESVNYFQKLYYHRLGTTQDKDTLVYESKEHKDWQFSPTVTDDGKYLIITVAKGTDDKYRILVQDLSQPGSKLVELINNFDAEYTFIDNDGPVLWFKTDLNAPRGKIIAIDLRKPTQKDWKELIPQSADNLAGVSVLNNLFVARYLKDAYAQVKVFDLSGKLVRDLPLPGIGSVGGFGGKRSDKETFYAYTSFNTPATIYRLDLTNFASTVFKQPQLKFNPADFETKQIFYTSKDGTRVPMFVSSKKGVKADGNNPTYLYGYGGFNIPITPGFSVFELVMMERGAIIAKPNLRGGGEYGEDWHKAGTKLRKQNVFDDFIAAAEWLINNKWTQPKRLAIAGGSNGGLLVGATMTQRPELFGAALPAVGVMDMLRFHKFTIGWEWIDDYGSSDNAEEFKALHRYSPYHNIKAGTTYPATLVTTADHDDRVVPGHSFKFAAALQAAQKSGGAPVLIRIEVRAGHGAGKPTSKRIAEAADVLSFLSKTIGLNG
ncbi:MAG TPA: prolyl oligopeptidase family serine peptidase [Pseudomonadota bacterium]|nr:prolyl oligopeptidase family serine peptidase [Pseudomonadota bacterium]